jgi:hypothetical protein
MPPSGTSPPAPKPHADESGINTNQPQHDILTLGSARVCRKMIGRPGESLRRVCAGHVFLLHAAAHHAPRCLVYLSLGVGCVASGETYSPDSSHLLHAGVMRLLTAPSRPSY